MEIKRIAVEELNFAAYNPRKDLQLGDSEYEKLKNSIKAFGYVEPVVWNKRTGNVVGGHQRLKVLIAEGCKEIDCSVVDLSDEDEKALNIALNKISGEWDDTKLAELLKELSLKEIDVSLTGFDDTEIDKLIAEAFEKDITEDDFDVEAELDAIEQPITKRGDVWQLGQHRLVCGDATNESDVKLLMQGEQADMLLTDPPYNVDYHSNAGSIANDNMPETEFAEFLKNALTVADGVLKPGGVFYIWHSDSIGHVFRKVCQDVNWKVRQCLIWNKSHFVIGRQDYQWKHEPCLYGWKDGAAHYFAPVRTHTTVLEDSVDIDKLNKAELKQLVKELMRPLQPTTVIDVDKPLKSIEHPTMKPVKLFAELINNSLRMGEVVVDIFGGSGTTIVACEQLDRSARVLELDPRYCDVIVERYKRAAPNEAVLLNDEIYKG